MTTTDPEDERDEAIRQIKRRRSFQGHAATYVIINLMLVGIWAMSGGGYFWPAWSILGWGVGLGFHAYSTYGERSISEADIQDEIERRRGH